MRQFILYGILFLAFVSCTSTKSTNQKRLISVSIYPQKYFVEQITGDFIEVNVLIPPGASPASYDPTPRQIADLENSDAYLMIGHIGFEKAWIEKFRSVNPEMRITDLSEGIDLIKGAKIQHGDHFHEGGVDPHIWVSPKRVKTIAENIYKSVLEIDPEREKIYTRNYRALQHKLDSADRKIEEQLGPYTGRSFLIFHPALTYLAADYGVIQIPIELEGKEPSPGYMIELIDRAKNENIKIIFVQQQFDMDNARAIADELGGEIEQINPLEENWFSSLEHIVTSLTGSFQNN